MSSLIPPVLASAKAPLVFRGVTVIDVRDGQRRSDQVVVVVGRRIQAITAAGTAHLPKGARVVDAHGKYLIPGLWDMHVHPNRYTDVAFPLFLAKGVTAVRDAGSMVPLDTLGLWKREIAAGTRIGPRYLVSGPALDSGAPDDSLVRNENPQFLDIPLAMLSRVVDSLQRAGADFIKTYSLTREGYFAVAAEARRTGIVFGGHLPSDRSVDGLEAADSGATFLDHEPYMKADWCGFRSDSVDDTRCAAAAAQLRHHNTWVVLAPVGAPDSLAGQATGVAEVRHYEQLQRFMPHSFPRYRGEVMDQVVRAKGVVVREPTSAAEWVMRPNMERWSAFMHRARTAGLPMLAGSDFNLRPDAMGSYIVPGFSMPEGLLSFVALGLTPLEALQIATLDPALALQATDSLGTVETGKLADLVLLDADPLADIWNLTKMRAVVANGRYYDRQALDRLLVQAEQIAARR